MVASLFVKKFDYDFWEILLILPAFWLHQLAWRFFTHNMEYSLTSNLIDIYTNI